MKFAKSFVRSFVRSIPQLRFEDQALSTFGGAVVFEKLFDALDLRRRLARCASHLGDATSYGRGRLLIVLVVHVLLGWRRLRDIDYYRDDPEVLRLVRLRRMPTFATLSRRIRDFDARVIDKLRALIRSLVMDRIDREGFRRLTLDFDGTVESTKGRRTEGTAVGFNKKAKGCRSYYPLMATVAQTGQVLDLLHRPGNVHDSRGARDFIQQILAEVRNSGFDGQVEARLDSAHFSLETCQMLDREGVEFAISVPFHAHANLKVRAEGASWRTIDDRWSFSDLGASWHPKSWPKEFRVVVYRQLRSKPLEGPLQLDLFEPVDWEYEFKAVVTNKLVDAKKLLEFHNGRGSQERIFAELKTDTSFGTIALRRALPNQVYRLCAVLAHNLARELQMRTMPRVRGLTLRRAACWTFEHLGSFRKRVIQRAARLTYPQGKPTLTLSANESTAGEIMHILEALDRAA